ncbi:LPXTG cell wall anchor domain-containing protein [bacterium]|nr:LPXTG cell wall anchor domain-containing protein [bacterium]
MNGSNAINNILYWGPKILIIFLGSFFIVYGGHDDSPGLQGLGLIVILTTITIIIRKRKKKL